MNPQWWRNLLSQDRPKLVRIGILAALGLALLVAGSFHQPAAASKDPPKAEQSALVAQEQQTETQLVSILQAIPNVGRVKVAVTLSRTIQSQFVSSSNSVSGGPSPLLVENGSGQTVVPLDEVGPSVQGVVVVARSASNPVVRTQLAEAVETLLQIPAFQVLILPS